MMKKHFVIALVFRLLCAGFFDSARAADNEWVPVPLEELQRATLRRPAPKRKPANPKVLPEAESPATTPAKKSVESPATEPASAEKPDRLTAEEIARRLRSNRSSPVVPPRGYKPRRKVNTNIAQEGQAVAGRIGRVEKVENSDVYMVTFENNRTLPYQSPRLLLPCRLLEELETHLQANPNARYRLSGETTRDTKNVYMLLQRVAIVEEGVTDIEPEAPTAEDETPASQPASQPAENPTTGLIAQMLQDRPGRAMKIAATPSRKATENVESVAPAGRRPFDPGKRDLVVDRIVRILPEPGSQWWQARFESDNTLREPPLRILPGLRLEWIKMSLDETGNTDMRLRVSGDITYYKGKRYLMLRKVLRQRDLDEF